MYVIPLGNWEGIHGSDSKPGYFCFTQFTAYGLCVFGIYYDFIIPLREVGFYFVKNKIRRHICIYLTVF